jgi:hypothetical protein
MSAWSPASYFQVAPPLRPMRPSTALTSRGVQSKIRLAEAPAVPPIRPTSARAAPRTNGWQTSRLQSSRRLPLPADREPNEAPRAVKRLHEAIKYVELAVDAMKEEAAALVAASAALTIGGAPTKLSVVAARVKADVDSIRAMLTGGCLGAATNVISRSAAADVLDSQAFVVGVALLSALDALMAPLPEGCNAALTKELATSQRETPRMYAAALRDKAASTVRLLNAPASVTLASGATCDLSCDGCAGLRAVLRTPRSVGVLYTPPAEVGLEFTELLRPLWAWLDDRCDFFEKVAASIQNPATHSRPAPPSAAGATAQPAGGGYRGFRPPLRAKAAVSHDCTRRGVAHQRWHFDALALRAAVERHEALWAAFQARSAIAASAPLTVEELARSVYQPASVSAFGVVPWPETLLQGLQVAAQDGSLFRLSNEELAPLREWVRMGQRRWHPDRLRSLALRLGMKAEEQVTKDLAARVTEIAQAVNGLRSAMDV